LNVHDCIIAFLVITTLIVSFVNAEELNTPFSQLQMNNSSENVNIQKGFSLLPNDELYQIPIGSIIYHSSDGITKIFDSNGTQTLIAIDNKSQRITTSAGDIFATSSLQVPSGALIKENMNRTDVILNNKSILTIIYEKNLTLVSGKSIKSNNFVQLDNEFNGYVEEARYGPVYNLGSFTANWTIPSSPPQRSGPDVQDDLWNGIAPREYGPGNGPSVVQPVTTWLGNHWTSVAVYVNSYNHFFYTEGFNSAVGDTIKGEMVWIPAYSRWHVIVWDYTANQFDSNLSVEAPEITAL